MGIAHAVACRSPCSRRQFGAILVKNDSIIATGYNGSVRGAINCGIDCDCLKDTHNEKSYKSYAYCPAVHAETNAILNAARNGISVKGSILFLTPLSRRSNRQEGDRPCHICRRMLINAGFKKCVYVDNKGKYIVESIVKWVELEDEWIGDRTRR